MLPRRKSQKSMRTHTKRPPRQPCYTGTPRQKPDRVEPPTPSPPHSPPRAGALKSELVVEVASA